MGFFFGTDDLLCFSYWVIDIARPRMVSNFFSKFMLGNFLISLVNGSPQKGKYHTAKTKTFENIRGSISIPTSQRERKRTIYSITMKITTVRCEYQRSSHLLLPIHNTPTIFLFFQCINITWAEINMSFLHSRGLTGSRGSVFFFSFLNSNWITRVETEPVI